MKLSKLRTKYNGLDEATRDIANLVNNEPTFTVTLSSGTAATSVSNSMAGYDSVMVFLPMSANAATDMNSMFISAGAKLSGSFTITHANNGNGDRTFQYAIIG